MLHRKDAHEVNNQVKKSFGNSRKANAGEQEKVTSGASSRNAQTAIDQKITAALTHKDKTQEIFLQTATVHVNVQGEIVYLRAILDSASQNNLVKEAAVQRLQLKRKRNNTRVFGLGGNEISANCGFVDLCLQPKNKAPIIIDASVLTKMMNDLPSVCINTDNWEAVKELQLADPDFNKPAQVDLILGAGHYEDLMVGNNQLKEPNTPVTYRLSVFGWLVIGRKNMQTSNSSNLQTCFVSSFEDNLQRFWEIEEVPATKHLTDEERRCEENFNPTTRRNPEGRFIVKLPFKKDIGELGDSQQQARRRLRILLHRLQKQPDLYRRYNEFIQEFNKLGHMEEVPAKEMLLPKEKSFYLSHHCLFKDSSTTTKLRLVFDGSAKTTSGIPLNDRLMVGPKIQKDLFSILMRFRMYPVALSADIAKMYRHVQLDAEDKDSHRILWKEPNSTDRNTLRMTRFKYGKASSSFHSVRPLQV